MLCKGFGASSFVVSERLPAVHMKTADAKSLLLIKINANCRIHAATYYDYGIGFRPGCRLFVPIQL